MIGQKRDPTTPVHELEAGDYVLHTITYRDCIFDAWWYCSPNGLIGRLSMSEDVALGVVSGCHHVEEHEDGTISVLPQPGNSNSIFVEGWPHDAGLRARGEPLKFWHGYIRHGVWEPC